jgi:hypothetical protein
MRGKYPPHALRGEVRIKSSPIRAREGGARELLFRLWSHFDFVAGCFQAFGADL